MPTLTFYSDEQSDKDLKKVRTGLKTGKKLPTRSEVVRAALSIARISLMSGNSKVLRRKP